MITTNIKGHIAELKAQLRANELGYIVSIPAHHCRYDFVLDDGTKLYRAQVKYADSKLSHSKGSVRVQLTYETRGRKKSYTYSEKEIDILIVYIPKVDKLCWITKDIFCGKNALTIRISPSHNNQKSKIIYANDHFW